MAVVFKNNAKTTLSAGITSSATSITVTDGSVFPSLSGGDVFFLTLDDLTNNEIVKCTAISGNTLTVVRAQEGTTARAFSANNQAELRITAGILGLFSQTDAVITDEIEAYLDANGLTFPDNVIGKFGSSNDLQIYHDGSNSHIKDSGTGELKIASDTLRITNAAGNETSAKFVEDSFVELFHNNVSKFKTESTGIRVEATGAHSGIRGYGTSPGVYLHDTDSTTGWHMSSNGALYFLHDTDGDGAYNSIAGYFDTGRNWNIYSGALKMGASPLTIISSGRVLQNLEAIQLADSKELKIGTGNDLKFWHSGSGSNISHEGTGDLTIRNTTDDADIRFMCDDGSGGITNYFLLDGSQAQTRFEKDAQFGDSIQLKIGSAGDMSIQHNGTDSKITNNTGTLEFRQNVDDGDITFRSDDGSGGTAEYFRVDGGSSNVLFSKNLKLSDSVNLQIGDGTDFQLSHNGTNTFMANNTGIFYITQNTDDANLLLRADDGSGGVANYITLKGSTGEVILTHYGNNRFKTTTNGVDVLNGGLFVGGTEVITSARAVQNINTLELTGGANYFKPRDINWGDYSFLGQTGSGAMTILGHNAFVDTTTNNTVKAKNNSWYASFIKMYYNQGITFHTSSGTVSAGDTLLSGTGTNSLERLKITSGGDIQIKTGDLQIGSTTVIDSSRNFTANNINLTSELNFTGNGNKYIDVETLALSNALTIRHHNPSGNLFETAMIMYANGGTIINYDGSGRLSTTSAGASITGSLNITSAITHNTHGTILDSSANLTNINNVYASGYRIGSTQIVDSSRNLTNIGTISATGLSVASDTDTISTLGRAKIGAFVTDYAYFSHIDNATSTAYALNQNSAGSTSINAQSGQNVALKINNSSKLFLSGTTHNVGINTTSPSEKLHINGGSSDVALRVDTTNADPKIRLTTLGQQDWTLGVDYSDSGKFKINESGTVGTLTALTIDASRNVGIGTETPAYRLDLGTTPSTFRLVSQDGGTAIRIGTGGGSSDVVLLRVDGMSSAHDGETDSGAFGYSFKYFGLPSGNANRFGLLADNQTGTQVEAFSILQDGKMGINNTNPTARLDVTGGIKASGDLVVSTTNLVVDVSTDRVGMGTSTPTRPLHVKDNDDVTAFFESTDANSFVHIKDTVSGISIGSDSSGHGVFAADIDQVGNKNILFKNAGATKATLNTGGSLDTLAGYSVGTTQVIDSSRNIVNVGTISSGAITGSSSITALGTGDQSNSLAFQSGSSTNIWKNISIRRYLQQSHADALSDGTHLFTASPGGSPTDAAFAYGAFIIQCRDNSNTGFAVRIGNGSGVGTAFRINSAKNAFFTGTISSGAITSSGLVTADELSVTNDATFNGAIDASGQTITSGAITTSDILTVDYTAPTIRLKPDNGAFFQLRANESPARLEVGHSTNKNLYLSNNGNATFNYDLTVSGDLTVNGTTTTLNTATLDVEDKNITLNYSTGDSSGSANGAGFTIQDAVSAGNDATILWDATNDEFDFSHGITLPDDKRLKFGAGNDLQILHNGNDSFITNYTNDLYITNTADDKDIIFRTDDGSGSYTTYLQLDGSDSRLAVFKETRFYDSVKAVFGNSADLQIYHDATNSVIWNQTGHLTIQNTSDDKDIIFRSDDGSGGLVDYLIIDGSAGQNRFNAPALFFDNKKAMFGDGADLQIYHDGSHSLITNATGNIDITNNANDGDMFFKSDDGSGGVATYIQLDGGTGKVNLRHYGSKKLETTSTGVDVTGGLVVDHGNWTSSDVVNVTTDQFDAGATFQTGEFLLFGDHDGSADKMLSLKRAGTDVFMVDRNGQVGIGTDSPSQKLHVAGNIYAASGFVNSSGYQLNGTYIVDSSRNLVNIVDATINGEVGIGTTPSSTWKTIIQSQYPLQLKSNTGAATYEFYAQESGTKEFRILNSAKVVGYNQNLVLDTNSANTHVRLNSNGVNKLATTSTGIDVTGILKTSGTSSRIDMQEDHYINRRFELDSVDNNGTIYVLLCEFAADNDVNGTIKMDRTSGLRHACSVDVLISSGNATTPVGTIRSMGVAGNNAPTYSLVKGTHTDSKVYIALKIVNPDNYYETSGAYFTGRIKTTVSSNEFAAVTTLTSISDFDINSKTQLANLDVNGSLRVTGSYPTITLTDTNNNPDFTIVGGSGQIAFYDETASAYVYQFISDQHNFAAKNLTNIGTISSGAITSSGALNVGIGANGQYMVVGGDDASNGRALKFTSSTSGGSVGAQHQINASSTNGVIALATNSTNRMFISKLGFVGIGTATPPTGFRFEIAHGTDTSDIIGLSGGHTGRRLKIRSFTNSGFAGAGFLFNADSAYGAIKFQTTSTDRVEIDNAGHFDLKTGNYKVNGTTVIDSSRNLHNIGTFNGKLSVSLSSSHTTGTISSSNAILDLYNPLEADTDEKGTIITFSDNYYDGNYNKTTRAAIKGGTDTTGNTSNGFLAFYTDSGAANTANERARFDSSGKFGIGTTNPTHGLTVVGSADSDASSYISINDPNNVALSRVLLGVGGDGDGQITLKEDGNSTTVFINSEGNSYFNGGNVGIGTNNPANKLDVVGTIYSQGGLRIGSSASGEGIFRYNPGAGSGIAISTQLFTTAGIKMFIAHTAAGGGVGIGTTDPEEKLEVAGNIRMQSAISTTTARPAATVATLSKGEIRAKNSDASDGGLLRLSAGAGTNLSTMSYIDLQGYSSAETGNGKHIIFGTSGSDKMIINSSGYVGIGNSSPSEKLHVSGNILIPWSNAYKITGNVNQNVLKMSYTSGVGDVLNIAPAGDSSGGEIALKTTVGSTVTERVRIDSAGNVGIGTDNPAVNLHVQSSAPKLRLTDSDTNADSDISASSSNGSLFLSADTNNEVANSVLAFQVDGATKAYIGTDGLYTQSGSTANKILDNSTRNLTNIADITATGQVEFLSGTGNPQSTDKVFIGGSGLNSADAAIYIGNNGSGAGVGWRFFYEGSGSGNDNKLIIKSENQNNPVDALSFTQDGAATFGNTISSGAITSTGVSSFGSGTTVGSVELDGSKVGIAEAGLLFQPNASFRCIHPTSLTSTAHSSDISLGFSNNKFKDIYLAGFVKADSGYQIGTTTVIDSSRNLTPNEIFLPQKITHFGDNDTHIQFPTDDTFQITTGNNLRFQTNNSGVTVLGVPLHISQPNSAEIKFNQTTSSTTASKGSIQWFDSNSNSCGTINLKADGAEDNSGVMEFYVTAQTDELGDDPFGINKMMSIKEMGVEVHGALSKNSGSFKIDHPLKPDTHHLVHSFVEGPQADNLYRGVIKLENGRATVDLDEWFGMTAGTFLALNRDIQAFVNNSETWDAVRAKVMGSQLVIECQNPESSAEVSWLVIGERQDKEIHESSLTNDNGKIIVEPEKVG